MAKLTAWLVTLIGIILILPKIKVTALESYSGTIIALAVLVIGIGKLMRNYSSKRK